VATVRNLYADYSDWPNLFPTIKGVQLMDQRGLTAVLEVDHVEGHVINELTVTSNEIRLWEVKRHYDALFVNQFHAVPQGTRFVVQGEIHLKGAARLLRPFLGHFVRQQMERWQLLPVKAAAEARSTAVIAADIGPIDYIDVGTGPPVMFLHGVLMAGDVWQPVVDRLRDTFRCIVPTLPLGAHHTAVRPDADLTLAGFGHLVLDLLEKLDLRDVTLVGNDHAAVLAAAVLPSTRIAGLVITSCEAFENYPPGLPGKNLRLTAALPGGLLAVAHLMRIKASRRLPVTFGWLSKRPLPEDLVDGWLLPLRHDAAVRRDLRRYAAGARRRHMSSICERLGAVSAPTLVVWTPEDRIQRVEHGTRLAEAIPGAQLKQINDSYTLMMRDQPDRLAWLLRDFIAQKVVALPSGSSPER
jgi:pimeloyl-ACP methyl ester carboxylesterase